MQKSASKLFRWCLGSLPLVLTLSGCAAPAAFADWERGADLAPGKSFAVTASKQLPKDLSERQKTLVSLVSSTVERELTQKGYTKAPADVAELVVNFYVVAQTRQKVTVQSKDCYSADRGELPPGASWDSTVIACEEALISDYDERTLIIDVYAAASKQLVWHGWKSREALAPDAPELPGIVEQATVDILSNFPPG